MRIVLAVAALATAFAVTAAKAEPTYIPGGPLKQGNLCQYPEAVSEGFYGYVGPCPQQPKAAKIVKKRKS